MPKYSAFIALDNGPGHYQELDELIDAPDPRSAAQRAIELAQIHPDEEFPQLLVIEERAVSIFTTRDDQGQAVTFDEDLPRLAAKGPETVVVHIPADHPSEEG